MMDMRLEDIRKYRGYMPVRMEREDAIAWLGRMIGGGWIDGLWLSKYSGYHEVRYRFGDVQEAQLYMRDGSWKGMPISVWLKVSEMDTGALDEECWKWILGERRSCGVVRKATVRGGLLDL